VAKKEAKAEKEEQENEGAVAKSGMSTVKIIIIAVTLTLVLGGGLVGGTYYFVSSMNPAQASTSKDSADTTTEDAEEDADEEEEVAEDKVIEPPHYFSMDPKFVVSFSNQKFARFMQFSLEIMSRDAEVIKKVEEHNPVIRSSLLMLFGSQGYDEMVTREGKEKLLKDAATDINNTLQAVTGDSDMESAVEAAYFTSFVIQ
jgi:flagellar FliL protein